MAVDRSRTRQGGHGDLWRLQRHRITGSPVSSDLGYLDQLVVEDFADADFRKLPPEAGILDTAKRRFRRIREPSPSPDDHRR
jgi:hypothetical protein